MDIDLDRRISLLTESTARRIGRRKVISKGLKASFGMAAGLAAGLGMTVKNAEAACTCDWAAGRQLSGCPTQGGCPSGWSRCLLGDPPADYRNYGCCGWCNYAYPGSWVTCSGLGPYGNGYRVCTDCKLSCTGTYPNWSCTVGTCLSGCICCYCQGAPVS